jgi:hypothetical protein
LGERTISLSRRLYQAPSIDTYRLAQAPLQ